MSDEPLIHSGALSDEEKDALLRPSPRFTEEEREALNQAAWACEELAAQGRAWGRTNEGGTVEAIFQAKAAEQWDRRAATIHRMLSGDAQEAIDTTPKDGK